MTATCNLTEADYRAFRRHFLSRYIKIYWLYGGLAVLLLLLTWLGGKPEDTTTEKVFALVGGIVVFGGLLLIFNLVIRVIRRFTGTPFQGTLGQHVFEISDESVTESNTSGRVETRLAGIRSVDETPHHFFVITTAGTGHVIPKRDLPSFEAIRSLRMQVGKAAPGAPPNAGPTTPSGNAGATEGPPSGS